MLAWVKRLGMLFSSHGVCKNMFSCHFGLISCGGGLGRPDRFNMVVPVSRLCMSDSIGFILDRVLFLKEGEQNFQGFVWFIVYETRVFLNGRLFGLK